MHEDQNPFPKLTGDDEWPTGSFSKEHSVVIHFMYLKEELDALHELDLKLDKLIREKGVGVYDWHEINLDMTDGTLYMYGPNAEALFNAVKPVLEETDFTKNAVAVLRFGGLRENASVIEVEIGK
jgi:hypothetical protein